MTKLYELAGQYRALAELADDPDMPAQALADSLEGLEGEIEVKAEALLQVVAGLDGDTGAIDAEIRRLQHRKQVIANRAQRLREYLRENMEATGIDKIECPLFKITLTKPRPMAVINDESQIPDRYIKTIRTPNKTAILADLKTGKQVPGCALGETKRGLLVK